MTHTLVLLSGGLDSTTLLARVVDAGTARLALSADYGQRHRRELDAARAVAAHYGVAHTVVDLSGWGRLLDGSALTDASVPVPHGHYAAPSMASTVVPNRNATLISAAAGVAIARGCDTVAVAVHAGDHPVYPDCRPEFLDAMNTALRYGTQDAARLVAPFAHWDKTAIVAEAHRLGAPVELSWSCYEGGPVHCGRCGTCVERAGAFFAAGVTDPTEYADPDAWRSTFPAGRVVSPS